MLEKEVKAIVYSGVFLGEGGEIPTTECRGSEFKWINVLLASMLCYMFETELERETILSTC